ncbi:MAG TPA: tripartite tricarboxylate transporter substrate binding protein [Burkholderiales bacterium]|nr:tripartite tricarboxylate transporter substrate binding protein [Burkholderiales bacterium]
MLPLLLRVLVLALGAAGAAAGAAAAERYPARPVRMIVPFPPGGPTDVVARILAQKLTEAWGQQVVVDNRSGAGGNIGMGIAANSTPDGYTVLLVSSSFVANPSLYAKIPYDPHKSFAPVTKIVSAPHAFFAHPSQPVKTIADLVAQVRRDPKKFSMATPGIGTTPDLSAHLLRLDAKLDLVLVPYAGGGPSLAAVLGNQVPFGCQAIPPVTPHFKAGRLRALAMTSAQRVPALPEVPTMAEAGYPGHEADTMTGMLLPAGTPRAIVERWHSETARVMALPEVKERIAEMGFNIVVNPPREFAQQIREEVARWGKVIRQAGIRVE